ncbi:hypothetical protein OPV22_034244 [Ensete ventricosum]|uniref:BHLH domain-containing protein n=1 Tax=Ensete ventricosum TaxID=4639 RepID=A0AAV8PWI0_ENSVE|nr:hypothetical protein OPV22_034244 [Ensete ventricosum]
MSSSSASASVTVSPFSPLIYLGFLLTLLSVVFFLMERPWLLEKAKRRWNASKRHEISGTRRRRKWRSASRASVQRKVRTLQGLVPGGRRLQPEQLFLRTADYIFQLRLRVHVLRALSKLYLP